MKDRSPKEIVAPTDAGADVDVQVGRTSNAAEPLVTLAAVGGAVGRAVGGLLLVVVSGMVPCLASLAVMGGGAAHDARAAFYLTWGHTAEPERHRPRPPLGLRYRSR